MSVLHYQVTHFDHTWVVCCEDVPIEAFDDRNDALSAATRLVNMARHRGNHVTLQIDTAKAKASIGDG